MILIIGVLVTLFSVGALAQYDETLCHPDDIPPTILPWLADYGFETCQACLNVDTLVICSGSEGEICNWYPCSTETDPSESQCGAGDTFPGFVCQVCVNMYGTDLCAEGETSCLWGNDPTNPDCAIAYTEAPLPQCHPDDEPPTAPPIFDILGIEFCQVCLNIDTYERCSGDDGAACTWLDCVYEIGGESTTTSMTLSPSQCVPGSSLNFIPECPSCVQECINPTGQLCVTGDSDCDYEPLDIFCTEYCDGPTYSYTEAPSPQCHPDDEPPTAPPIYDNLGIEFCQVCLNIDTYERCSGDDGEACTWLDCLYEIGEESTTTSTTLSPSFGLQCDPGSYLNFIPDCPSCVQECINPTGQLCVDGDSDCYYEPVDIFCIDDCDNSTNSTLPPITILPNPLDNCLPGSSYEVYPGCELPCISSVTFELCTDEDAHCEFNIQDLLEICSDDTETYPPSTVRMSYCQPGDAPQVSGFLCLGCLNEDNEPCQEGQFCDLEFVDFIQCIPSTTPTSMASCQPEEEPMLSSEGVCNKCLTGNGQVCQEGDMCFWQVVETYECVAPTTQGSSAVKCYPEGRLSLKVGEIMDDPNPNNTCNTCVCTIGPDGMGKLECNSDKKCGELKRLSVVFKTDNCFYVIYNDTRREEFMSNFEEQLKSLTRIDAKDMSLKCGSIIAEFTVTGTEDQPVDVDEAKRDIDKLIREGKLTVEVDSDVYKATALRDITDDKKPEKSVFGLPMRSWYIIIAIVALAVLALLMLTITVCVDRARSRREEEKFYQQDDSYDNAGGFTADREEKVADDGDNYDDNQPRNDYLNTSYNM